MSENIILGEGTFYRGETPVGLTRGGGQFQVEREYREVEADGDKGPVKGRVRIIRSVAKLTMNLLEIIPEDMVEMYPALEVEGEVITAKDDVEDDDYLDEVSWVGKTKGGKDVIITLENAINLENIDWTMGNQDEIVPTVTYTAAYDPDDRVTEPWNIEFVEAEY